ncbi:MAG: M42 family peptidase, partial [Candidatus Parcubacteria bacterium]|nr:M42 family peptidase [Candidatus Parcubacteria bacterium]
MKKRFLAALMGEICPTGHEWEARKVWREEARTIAHEVRGDFHGNSIAVLNPDADFRIMLAGHI